MINFDMPLWWQIIQLIGWLEIATLFILLPFERKYQTLEKAQRVLPNNPLSILIIVIIGTPIAWAGIFACVSYSLFLFVLWLLTR